jgi:hypothetical protein
MAYLEKTGRFYPNFAKGLAIFGQFLSKRYSGLIGGSRGSSWHSRLPGRKLTYLRRWLFNGTVDHFAQVTWTFGLSKRVTYPINIPRHATLMGSFTARPKTERLELSAGSF